MRFTLVAVSLLLVVVMVVPAFAGVAGLKDRAVAYTVQKGDCIIKMGCRGGEIDPKIACEKMVELNPSRFAGKSLDLIFIGEILMVPASWAEGLGIEVPKPPVLVQAAVVERVITQPVVADYHSLRHAILACLALAAMIAVLVLLVPWNFFRPAGGGPAMVPGGVNTVGQVVKAIREHVVAALQADLARLATVPRPFKIERLWEVKLYGLLEVVYADGRIEQRVASGQTAWLAELSDGSRWIILQRCGNDVHLQGNRNTLLDGHYEIVREIPLNEVVHPSWREILPVEPQAIVQPSPRPDSERTQPEAEPQPQPVSKPETDTEGEGVSSMMYPMHPCVVGRTMRMIRFEAAIRGGGLRRD